jgi:hypothetical protein
MQPFPSPSLATVLELKEPWIRFLDPSTDLDAGESAVCELNSDCEAAAAFVAGGKDALNKVGWFACEAHAFKFCERAVLAMPMRTR